ncbi:hypothetical protein VTL71DRAFT_10296 [Oculimacula yallundae]|uniref:Uncharacterized protein n=1 Tax=Oculimacula yallundae TaxID=86028 RepID=A0ABR4CT40_9HELO
MTLSRKSTIILQFTLIICISAIIAGLAGGLTSRVTKWSDEVEGDRRGVIGNRTVLEQIQMESMGAGSRRREVEMEAAMEKKFESGEGSEMGSGRMAHDRCRRRERRRVVGGRRYEL